MRDYARSLGDAVKRAVESSILPKTRWPMLRASTPHGFEYRELQGKSKIGSPVSAGTCAENGFQRYFLPGNAPGIPHAGTTAVGDRRMHRRRSGFTDPCHSIRACSHAQHKRNAYQMTKSQLFHHQEWESWLCTFCVRLTCSAPFSVVRHPLAFLSCTLGSTAETLQAPYPHIPLSLFSLRRLGSVSTKTLFDCVPYRHLRRQYSSASLCLALW